MQEFKEHWVQIRTPEQFAIFFNCCQEVADLAKAKMAPMLKSQVAGFTDFKSNYEIPELYLEVDSFTMTLSGTPCDLYGLSAFLEDPQFFGFEKMDGNYTLQLRSKKEVAEKQADLVQLTETWGWQLNL